MKISRIIAAAAAAGALLALCGCSDSGGSSSESAVTSSNEVVQPASKQTDFTTEDGLFTLELNERFSKYEGVYPAEFEFLFVDNESDTTVGILEMSGLHITPAYYCDTIKSHYDELYGSVTSSEDEWKGLPAHLLEAKFTDEESETHGEYLFYHKAIGYGNGDLLVLVVTVPADKPEDREQAVSDIMEGMTYLGDPIKAETEVHDTEFFTVSADKDWYFHSKDEAEATLRPNIADSTVDHFGSLKISAQKSGSSAKELADKDAEEFAAKEKITNVVTAEGVQCLGRDAVCVSCVLESDYMNLRRDICYFDENGVNYQVQILAPEDGFDGFTDELGAVYDSIEIK
ncbi:MAG: hypothetical protein IKP78_00245 [Ruminococcus sp.]|nr:hypothetical protein [Ruminococcus sp.]